MSDFYVYSTLTAGVNYGTEAGAVHIAGGANVPNKYMLTSAGVVTSVTADQLEALKRNRVFMLHHNNGFIRWEAKKHDVEKVVVDMERADASAPDTEADAAEFEKKTGTKTRTAKNAE